MIFVLACLGALALAFLVATVKVNFPLLFDAGIAALALSLIVWAAGVERGDLVPSGAVVLWITGGALMGASAFRQMRRRIKALRIGDPKEIDGRHFTRITGGKQ